MVVIAGVQRTRRRLQMASATAEIVDRSKSSSSEAICLLDDFLGDEMLPFEQGLTSINLTIAPTPLYKTTEMKVKEEPLDTNEIITDPMKEKPVENIEEKEILEEIAELQEKLNIALLRIEELESRSHQPAPDTEYPIDPTTNQRTDRLSDCAEELLSLVDPDELSGSGYSDDLYGSGRPLRHNADVEEKFLAWQRGYLESVLVEPDHVEHSDSGQPSTVQEDGLADRHPLYLSLDCLSDLSDEKTVIGDDLEDILDFPVWNDSEEVLRDEANLDCLSDSETLVDPEMDKSEGTGRTDVENDEPLVDLDEDTSKCARTNGFANIIAGARNTGKCNSGGLLDFIMRSGLFGSA
jgi:hypothetical protein